MQSIVKCIGLAVLAFSSYVAQSRTFDVTVWRGETTTMIMSDFARVGIAPKGLEVKVGTAKEVRYLTRPYGTHYQTLADRVEWGSTDVGVKVLSVSASADIKAGTYYAGDVKVTVIDRVLPPAKEWKFFLDLWQHPWAVARYFGVEPFSPAHYEKMRPLWETLASAGQKTLTVTLLDRPWDNQCYDAYRSMIRHIKKMDGSWCFDYTIFDQYVEFGRSCGLGPIISCYTMCPWGYVVTWEDEMGELYKMPAIPGTDEFKAYWSDFLEDFAAHLKEKGWFDDTVVSIDERMPDDVRNIASLIQEKAPGLKIALAGNRAPSEFEGIDIYHSCFGLSHLTDKLIAEASSRREKGMITTYYVCCGPLYPNTMCHNELEEAYWLGAYSAMVGLDGFLRWAWNSWPQDPMRDLSYTGIGGGGWKAGDTFLVYPDGSPSLRFLELRNGIVASEKIRILKEQGLYLKEISDFASKVDRAAAIKNEVNFWDFRRKLQGIVNHQVQVKPPRPTPRAALLERLNKGPEIIGIVHWGLNTYTDSEWGFGDANPEFLNPTKFNADQIVSGAKAGGLGGLVIVAKHHDGFCLWPTKTTDYNITQTPFWKQGVSLTQGSKAQAKGRDYIKEMADACKKHGLKFGVYVSPWDRHDADYGKAAYVEKYHAQIKELLGGAYGEVFEMWFDGANGGDGYYGGSRGVRFFRSADDYYRFDEIFRFVRELQPKVTIFAGENDASDLRWPGNERGILDESSRATIDTVGGYVNRQYGNPNYRRQINKGSPAGAFFRVCEADFPLRKGWFWHEKENNTQKSSAYLAKLYTQSVGNGGVMNIGLAPNREGLLDAKDVQTLKGFNVLLKALFANEVTRAGESFNVVVMSEDIAFGENVDAWRLLADGKEVLAGTAIGRKRIRLLPSPIASKSCEIKVDKKGGKVKGLSLKRYIVDEELVKIILNASTESGETDTAKWMTAHQQD